MQGQPKTGCLFYAKKEEHQLDNLTLDIIAKLIKKLSENSIDGDLKKLDNKISVKVLARLSKTLASRELKRQIETLNNMDVSIGTELDADNGLEHQLQQNINTLQQSIAAVSYTHLTLPPTSRV